MNTYIIYDTSQFDGEPFGTIKADTIDEAQDKAVFLYGPTAKAVRQYDSKTIGFDPLWILLAILLIAPYVKKKYY